MDMNLILLSGNSKRGGEWLKEVEPVLAPLFDQTYRHAYVHWANDEPEIDLDHETERLTAPAQELTPYMIFAKSAGTILTAKATAKGSLQPTACLFVGFPLVMVKNHHLPVDNWLRTTDFPITVLQHSTDPFGSYQDVKQYFNTTGRSNVTVHELAGDTHDYIEFQTLKDFTEKLVN
jgi:hypothetical protein